MQDWRTRVRRCAAKTDWYRPGLWPDFRCVSFRRSASCCCRRLPILQASSRSTAFRYPISWRRSAAFSADNTTTAIAGHTYMSSWPSWPFLVRPVWFLFDKIDDGPDRGGGIPRQSAGAVAGAARQSRIALRDFIVTRRTRCVPDRWRSISGPISPGRCCRARSASSITICRRRRSRALRWSMRCGARARRAGCYGPMWRSRRRLCRHAAGFGGIHRHLDADLQPTDDLPELDLSRAPR